MPYLCREFHLHPSDFGGDRGLTYAEIEMFLETAKQQAEEMRKQERKAKQHRTSGLSRRRRR